MGAVASKESTDSVVVELAPIIGLEREDGELELCVDIREKLRQNRENLRLVFQREGPCIVSIVIEHNQVKLISGNAYNWRSSYIKMQNLKWKHAETTRGLKRETCMFS